MDRINVIAIDGPAGSGKSTVAKLVAKNLKFLYIDTGAMYRALTLKAVKEGADFNDQEKLIALSKDLDVRLVESGGDLKVLLDGNDVSEKIRSMEITAKVKFVAGTAGVRKNMVRLQQKLGRASSGAVMEGRDIGTVVFPDAAHKFYLDANSRTRAERRFKELKEKGFDVSFLEVEKDVKARDASDMTRKVGALKKAKDARLIDTTDMTIEEVVDKILAQVKDIR
ncbi:MAG: (d)CMP kinase [Candidatus Omnitrophica bacterium]|nr:(d)CMP kinase [Candidatus Omnitrophota bacterium]